MTHLYLILVLCTFTNAYRRHDDVSVEHGVVPTARHHVVHEKHSNEAEDHSSRNVAVADVPKAHGHSVSGRRSQGLGDYRAVPQDVLNALQELSRRDQSQMLQRPPLPVQMNYQIPHKTNMPSYRSLYDMGRSAHDDSSAEEHESKHGDDQVRGVHHDADKHHPLYDASSRSDAVHSAHTAHEVSRGVVGTHHGVVEGSVVDAVRTPHVSEAHHETVKGGEQSAPEEAGRAGLYYLDDTDHTANRSPYDVNHVSPTNRHDNQEDSRSSMYMGGLGGMGSGGMGGLGGLGALGGLGGMGSLGGISGLGMNPYGGMSGIPLTPGGMKTYNMPQLMGPPTNQYPGLYGR